VPVVQLVDADPDQHERAAPDVGVGVLQLGPGQPPGEDDDHDGDHDECVGQRSEAHVTDGRSGWSFLSTDQGWRSGWRTGRVAAGLVESRSNVPQR